MIPLIDMLTDATNLAQGWLWAAFLVFLRVGAAMALLPAFGEHSVPQRIRLALGVCYTLVILPAVLDRTPPPPRHASVCDRGYCRADNRYWASAVRICATDCGHFGCAINLAFATLWGAGQRASAHNVTYFRYGGPGFGGYGGSACSYRGTFHLFL